VGNEENKYLVPDPNKTMINVTNEGNDIYKISLKMEIMEEIIEKLMEKLQDIVNQKVQHALKKCQDTTSKELEKTPKQLNEFREDLDKHQNETKENIKKRYMK
jgi:DNA-binding protein YbaB